MRLAAALVIAVAAVAACGGGDSGSGGYVAPEQAGSACSSPATCYPDVKDAGAIQGAVQCLTKVSGGYCTHLCSSDADCCAAPGECRYNYLQVCAPFENQPESYCFLSCEDADVKAAHYTDANQFCHTFANAAFNCRSTGGSSSNRKVCMGG